MTLRSDQKALLFLGAVAVLGAGVRALRAASARSSDAPQPALERQARAADSAAKAGRGKSSGKGAAKVRATKRVAPTQTPPATGAGLLDRPGYVGRKLDLDVATAAQIDSLPGVGPAMAKRIVRDRLERGPFVTRDGFRRVPGTGRAFLARIDSLVTFSGAVRHPDARDTIIPRGRR